MCSSDLEPVLQLLADFMQQAIVEARAGPHETRRQRRFGGAHGPDVKVVDFAHARKVAQIALHFHRSMPSGTASPCCPSAPLRLTVAGFTAH